MKSSSNETKIKRKYEIQSRLNQSLEKSWNLMKFSSEKLNTQFKFSTNMAKKRHELAPARVFFLTLYTMFNKQVNKAFGIRKFDFHTHHSKCNLFISIFDRVVWCSFVVAGFVSALLLWLYFHLLHSICTHFVLPNLIISIELLCFFFSFTLRK